MPVLGPTYRLNLLDMRKNDGTPCDVSSAVTQGSWGYNTNEGNNELYSATVASPDHPVATGIIPVTMPANYVAGTAFAIRLGVTNNSQAGPDEGSFIAVRMKRVPADHYDDNTITVLDSSHDWTVGPYTEYDFVADVEDVAALGPGDFLTLWISAEMFPDTPDSGDFIYFNSAFLILNPS